MTAIKSSEALSMGFVKAVFESEHIPALIKGEETHEPALRLTAQLVRHSSDDRLIEDVIRMAIPPDYNGNTISELGGMIADARRKGMDINPPDDADGDKQSVIAFNLLHQDGIEFFRDRRDRGYISIRTQAGGQIHYAVRSTAAELFVKQRFYEYSRRPISRDGCKEVLDLLEAKARFESEKYKPALRVGRAEDAIYIDLGREDGLVVAIDRAGWKTTYDCPVKFVRTAGSEELPIPKQGGSLKDLQDLLQLSDNTFRLALAFLLVCLRPGPTYMCLLVEGEQGSGKSFLCETIKRIIDPHLALKLRAPRTRRAGLLRDAGRHGH